MNPIKLSKPHLVKARTKELFQNRRHLLFQRTDRLFAALMIFQWLAGIAIALVISPLSWAGTQSAIHIHVMAAIFLGGAITFLPVYLAYKRPGQVVTRHVIAVSQMLFSALFIDLSGGRIETHFHVFGSLAFLAAYSDWRVLMTASAIVVADHVLRGIFWPVSVYGVNTIEPLRWLEHAWWVVFEDLFLIKACLNNVNDTYQVAQKQAEVEDTKAQVEVLVESRTKELHVSERRLATQYAVSNVLAESSSLADASPHILRAIATNMLKDIGIADGTVYGEIWRSKQDDELECICHLKLSINDSDKPTFGPDQTIVLNPSMALHTRVFTAGKAVQITDIASDENLPRRDIALQSGLKSAFAFPAIAENEVKAVISFFCESQNELTTYELVMLDSLGQQIGQFIVRKRAESDNAHLANIVQSSNDAIIGQTSDGLITSWNRGAERMFGYTLEEAKGQSVTMLTPEDRLAEMDQLTGGFIENFETVRFGKDRKRKDVSIASSPITSSENVTVGMSIIARDISERKEAEKRVNEFYSTVSHELRTPLTSIRGALGLIEGGVVEAGTDEGMDLIQVARTSCDRLIRLINNILDLKKIEAGKFDLRIQELDPRALIRDALSALAGLAEEAGIKLDYEEKTNCRVFGDKDRCIQVLTNLVSNAIKFSRAGSRVSVTTETSLNGMLRFWVSDTGPGIAAEHMHKLFDKFQQLDSSDTRAKEGTGLGLAISKAIVEEHGGEIGVNSTVGVGTDFWFEMPVENSMTSPLADKHHQGSARTGRTKYLAEQKMSSSKVESFVLELIDEHVKDQANVPRQ